MILGPTIIRKCLECFDLIEEFTILSGNTFGTIFWTDGKTQVPMLPDQPRFVKCPHCQALVWIDELEEVGKVEPILGNEIYKNAKSYDNNRVMMAEIKRELGQFEEAEILLRKPFASELPQAVSIIRELVQSRESFVAEMEFKD